MPKKLAVKLVAVLASVVSVTTMTNVPANADIVGTYRAFNEAGGGCMLVQGTVDNTNVVKWSGCWDADYPDQHWNFDPLYPDIYQIYNENSRKCLTVPNRSLNARAVQKTCTGSISQQWQLLDTNKPDWGDRMLRNVDSGLCLISQAGSTAVVQYTCMSQYRDQWWYLV